MKSRRFVSCAIAALLTGCLQVRAEAPQDGEPAPVIDYEAERLKRIVTALRITEEITLDGRLDEPAWDRAVPAIGLTQWQPQPGEPSSQRTEVRILYDEDNLYISCLCFDSDAANIVVNELREDYPQEDTDSLHLYIDSLHDRRSGFLIGTNPRGARRDAQISDTGQINVNWDGVWDARTTINEGGWIAEIAIPFKTLRFKDAASQEWGINWSRRMLSRNETSYWAPVPVRYRGARLELAGTLTGLENIRQGRNLKVTPFVTAGVTQTRVGGETQRKNNYDGGVDLKYSLTPSLTLDATYRTDFAQVEADQQQVNLTRFNLFFPEKRSFFLENAGVFSFGPGGNLVPFFSRSIGLAGSATPVPEGTPVPILGGARFTGQIDRYNVGLLAMRTDSVEGANGTLPANMYVVGRVRRSLLGASYVGALVTNRNSSEPGDQNSVYGADAHFEFDRLVFDSYLLKSNTPGVSGKDQARRFQAGWITDELAVTAEYNTVQTNFNPEMGFVRRGDMSQSAGELTWRPLIRSSESIRNLILGASLDYFEGGTTGKIETRTGSLSTGILFQNQASINLTLTNTFDRLVDSIRIQGLSLPAGDYEYMDYSARFTTDISRKVSGNGRITWGEFWDGRRRSLSGGLGVKPTYRVNMDFSYSRDRLELLDGLATSDLFGARLVYGFSPRSFFNVYVQYNGRTNELSTNIRYNIMYRPLSDLYIVYNDRRNTQTNATEERALIIKLAHLFSF